MEEKEKEKQRLAILWERIKIVYYLLGLALIIFAGFSGYLFPVEDGFEAFFTYLIRGVLWLGMGGIIWLISFYVIKFWILGKIKKLI